MTRNTCDTISFLLNITVVSFAFRLTNAESYSIRTSLHVTRYTGKRRLVGSILVYEYMGGGLPLRWPQLAEAFA